MEIIKEKILFLNFNQDKSLFAVGTDIGFKVFNTFPFKITVSRDLGGGIGFVEMLNRSNIFLLIGGGENPKKQTNILIIWDDSEGKIAGEMAFKFPIISTTLRKTKLIVILREEVFIYSFPDLKLENHMTTCPNPKGLFSVNNDEKNNIVAFPDKNVGHVAVHLYDANKKVLIKAHQSQLSYIELNKSGDLLATTSEKGMVIRIYSTIEGTQLHELRRGLEYANIYSLSFDPSSQFLAMSCDSGSVHIFSLTKEDVLVKNPTSKFRFLKHFVPYFDSEWCFAKFKGNDSNRTRVGFITSGEYCLSVLNYKGEMFTLGFDRVKGGECKKGNVYEIL